MALTYLFSYSQEEKKTKTYLTKIKKEQKTKGLKRSKLSKSLKSFSKGEKTNVSKKWLTKDNMVLVDAISSDNVSLLQQELVLAGMEKIQVHGNVVSGWIPMNMVSKLESCEHLKQVLPEFKPATNVGLTTSQAETTLFSAESSKIFDVDGTGVKVGILSDSFNTRGDADTTVASGDLPGVGNPNGFTSPVVILSEFEGEGSDEGRGMAELVHDIAPGAELYFYSAFNGFFDFADGIRALADAGCDVIVDDIGYFASPYFQDGAIAQAVDDVVAQGVVYLSSAGNSSRDSYEDEYKELGDTGLYDFGNGDTTQSLVVEPGQNLYLWFQWDDPSIFADLNGPTPDTDLDVYLYHSETSELLDLSEFNNPIDGYPIEIIDYTNETEEAITVELVISRYSGPAPRRIKYNQQGTGDINYLENHAGNYAGTCYGHSNAAGAIAVGAQAYVFHTEFQDAGYGGNTAARLNSFSSYGGIPILIDKDGNDLDEMIVREKPEVVGTDYTNTTSFPDPSGAFFDLEGDGFPNFAGTSAAAPHVAAVVALMLEEKEDLTPQEVITVLKETALDMDDPATEGFDVGYDLATGRGFVQADKALAAIQDEPTVYRYQAYNSTTDQFITTLKDDGNIYLDEVEGGLINVVALATDGLEDAKSTRFTLSGTDNNTVLENSAPFALFGDDSAGDLRDWEVATGDYQLSTVAFDQLNTQGNSGNTYTIGFNVDYLTTISSFILVDADTNQDIAPLERTMDISIFERYPNVTIRAELSSQVVAQAEAAKVKFNLTGALQRYTEDIAAPYSLFGDNNGDFESWAPSPVVGSYTIEATPYARVNGDSTVGISSSFSFEIVDNSALVEENTMESEVNLDAASKTLTVSTQSDEAVSFSVFNAQGALVFNGEATSQEPSQVNLSKYGSGLFIVKSEVEESLNSKIYIR